MFAVIILYIAGGFTYSGVIAYHMIKQAAGMTVTDKEKLKTTSKYSTTPSILFALSA